MNNRTYVFFLLCLGLIVIPGAVAGLPDFNNPVMGEPHGATASYVEGYVLVMMENRSDDALHALNEVNAKIGALTIRDYASFGYPGLSLVQLSGSMSVEEAVSYYSSQPGISYAEPDYYVTIASHPDDPEFWRQWGLLNTGTPYRENVAPGVAGADIHAPDAWNIKTSTDGVVVAVVDTGVDIGHPDLADNLWTDNQSGQIFHGYNVLVSDYAEPWDDYAHGTHCAGIIGMVGNNNLGGTGVAWNTSIMAIKALSNMGSGRWSDIIAGIAYASSRNVPVISCSFGNYIYQSRVMSDLIQSSSSLFVCAAGNSGEDTTIYPFYPACYNMSNVLAVAASDPHDSLAKFSNYGNTTIHVAAPGVSIFSSIPSTYTWDTFYEDPSLAPDNLTIQGNWTRIPAENLTDIPALRGVIPKGILNTSLVLELNQSVHVPYDVPTLIWDAKGSLLGNQRIEYSIDGALWAILQDNSGALFEDEWTQKFASLNSIPSGRNLKFRMTFNLVNQNDRMDLSIRNIRLGYRESPSMMNYDYYNGTSMATPMVSGMAGLIKSIAPSLTASEIRQVIIDSVDELPSMKDKVISGGRVNLTAALMMLQKNDEILVNPGWNHVSVPHYLASGADTARIFSGVNSSGHSILMFQNESAGYRTLLSTDVISPLQGYWLFSDNVTKVPVTFAEPVIGPSRQVESGWSSVGGWSDEDVSANKTLSSLGEGWSYTVGFNSISQQYDEPIMRGGIGNQSDLLPIKPYSGYWLYCNQNGTYQGPLF